ncbi:hypothetical protein KCU65_g1400, partial [Aureobasidium melanogenum]
MSNLEELWIDGDSLPSSMLCSLLQPSLLSVKLPDMICEDAVETLSTCTSLQKLSFEGPADADISELEEFMLFVEEHPCLRSIEFGAHIYEYPTNNSYEYKTIEFGYFLTEEDAQKLSAILRGPIAPNDNLVSLSIKGHKKALLLFLASAGASLRSLEIDLGHSSQSVFERISQFTDLTELRLDSCAKLHPNALDALTKLTKLKVLKVVADYYDFDDPQPEVEWTGEHFAEWIANFLNLQDLRLDWSTTCPDESAIAVVGKLCQDLEQCALGWVHNPSTWNALTDRTHVRFPKLKKLGLHLPGSRFVQCDTHIDKYHKEIVEEGLSQLKTILELAPRLVRLEFLKERYFTFHSSLKIAIETLIESPLWKDVEGSEFELSEDVVAKVQGASDLAVLAETLSSTRQRKSRPWLFKDDQEV